MMEPPCPVVYTILDTGSAPRGFVRERGVDAVEQEAMEFDVVVVGGGSGDSTVIVTDAGADRTPSASVTTSVTS